MKATGLFWREYIEFFQLWHNERFPHKTFGQAFISVFGHYISNQKLVADILYCPTLVETRYLIEQKIKWQNVEGIFE